MDRAYVPYGYYGEGYPGYYPGNYDGGYYPGYYPTATAGRSIG